MSTEQNWSYSLDREALERDSDVSFFVAGGPGGQHRNKVSTGVRLVHRPSGLVITATERRSQSANREVAFSRLAERLEAMRQPQTPRVATRPSRAAIARRLAGKSRRAAIKQLRRSSGDE